MDQVDHLSVPILLLRSSWCPVRWRIPNKVRKNKVQELFYMQFSWCFSKGEPSRLSGRNKLQNMLSLQLKFPLFWGNFLCVISLEYWKNKVPELSLLLSSSSDSWVYLTIYGISVCCFKLCLGITKLFHFTNKQSQLHFVIISNVHHHNFMFLVREMSVLYAILSGKEMIHNLMITLIVSH